MYFGLFIVIVFTDRNIGPNRKTISNKLESKNNYKSHEDMQESGSK